MDQEVFRNLLASSRPSQPDAKRVPTAANNTQQKTTTPASSEPTFKPRKVKRTEGKYRDRAAERREGIGNDYAQVEAVLEDFEKRIAHEDKDVIEEQRKYLGGDSEHTILVKGLDMSLLEQNRARAAASTEDDEILEQAYAKATLSSAPPLPKKRTREDIIRDLKAKRQNEDGTVSQPVVEGSIDEDASALEAAKRAGKFRPIGSKPIGQTAEKSKKRKVKEGKESLKKKPKVESASVQPDTRSKPAGEVPAVPRKSATMESSSSKLLTRFPEPEFAATLDEDLDIFAGAGDYEGFQGDEVSEEEDRGTEETGVASVPRPAPATSFKGWFDAEQEIRSTSIPPEMPPSVSELAATEEEEAQKVCLKPLESSAISSIRDFLAMDEAAEKAEKRKARKEGKKKKKKKAGDDDDD